MSLNAALKLFLEEYPKESKKQFANNPLGEFVRKEIPNYLNDILGKNDRFLVQASVGQGQWARVPWLAIFDKLITNTAQKGYYVVYLVKEDFSGVYLSLNQGVTIVKESYGSEAKHALKVRANDFLAQIGHLNNYIEGIIDLNISSPSSLGAFYEVGSICAKYYSADNIPNDIKLSQDLKEIISIYLTLSRKQLLITENASIDPDEENIYFEDLSRLREHKRIERNVKLVKLAKKTHGYVCQVCGFDFSVTYGALGNEYIEAHHLVPLSELKGEKIKLNPKSDFVVLCSNCHRMIHKSEFVGNIMEFKNKHFCSK